MYPHEATSYAPKRPNLRIIFESASRNNAGSARESVFWGQAIADPRLHRRFPGTKKPPGIAAFTKPNPFTVALLRGDVASLQNNNNGPPRPAPHVMAAGEKVKDAFERLSEGRESSLWVAPPSPRSLSADSVTDLQG